MPNNPFESAAVPADEMPGEHKVYGVVTATVVSNVDSTGQGRVQIRLPWLPGALPWARIAAMFAGMSRGAWFQPQYGDEVLVAFNHGDVRDPFILGALWNAIDRPPALMPTDAVSKRRIRTPAGQELDFDEVTQTVTVQNTTKQSVKIGPKSVEISNTLGTAVVTVGVTGDVSIQAAKTLTLKGTQVVIQGATVRVEGTVSATLSGGTDCVVQGGTVRIN